MVSPELNINELIIRFVEIHISDQFKILSKEEIFRTIAEFTKLLGPQIMPGTLESIVKLFGLMMNESKGPTGTEIARFPSLQLLISRIETDFGKKLDDITEENIYDRYRTLQPVP